jgi:hypothetical protein
MDDRRARLEAELRAIELWDNTYRRNKTHHGVGEVSYRMRQERQREIQWASFDQPPVLHSSIAAL